MRVAVLGGTGRTGRLIVSELLQRGHDVSALVRDGRGTALPSTVGQLTGDPRDRASVVALVQDCDAVCSALGARGREAPVNAQTARVLIEAMRASGVRRFVGISGAGITVPGDRKSIRDRVISAVLQRLGGRTVQDKAEEYEQWAVSGLDWTLIRPPRLTDGDATGEIEHAASTSPRRTAITRADLATLVVDCLELHSYVGAAPLVAGR